MWLIKYNISEKQCLPIWLIFDTRSCQLMVVGVPGLRGQPARSHAVEANRSGLVHVPTHHRRGEATSVKAYHVTIVIVIRMIAHMQVSRWCYIYLMLDVKKHSLSFTCICIGKNHLYIMIFKTINHWKKTFVVYYDINNYQPMIIILVIVWLCLDALVVI